MAVTLAVTNNQLVLEGPQCSTLQVAPGPSSQLIVHPDDPALRTTLNLSANVQGITISETSSPSLVHANQVLSLCIGTSDAFTPPQRLNDLSDVTTTPVPLDGSILVFNSSTGRWEDVDAFPREVAGEDIESGDLVSLAADGTLYRASSTFALNRWRLEGVARASTATGGLVPMYRIGERAPVAFAAPPGAPDNGAYVFLDADSGKATLTPSSAAGTVKVLLGVLRGADGTTLTPQILYSPEYLSRRP